MAVTHHYEKEELNFWVWYVAWPVFEVLFVTVNSILLGYAVNRLLFSPVSKFPGHDMSGVAYQYQGFFNVFLRGSYIRKLESLHLRWGPIVRATPHEIHISDPAFIGDVYAPRQEEVDDARFATAFPLRTFKSITPKLATRKRAAIRSFFDELDEHRVGVAAHEVLRRLLPRLSDFQRTGVPIDMRLAFRAVTCDILTRACFDKGTDFVSDASFNAEYFKGLTAYNEFVHWFTEFPLLAQLYRNLPTALQNLIIPGSTKIAEVNASLAKNVCRVTSTREKIGRDNLYHALQYSNELPKSEKAPQIILEEALMVLFVGQETTARLLSAAVYELLSNPDILARLQEELRTADPEPTGFSSDSLKSMPYLRAILLETVRCHPPWIYRAARICTGDSLHYHCPETDRVFEILPGVKMSMSPLLIHYNEDFFPKPEVFRPERFLEKPGLERFLLAFGNGPRHLMSQEMCFQIMSVILAGLFRKFDVAVEGQVKTDTLQLHGTKRKRDIDITADFHLPGYSTKSQGVQVLVK